MFLLLHYFIYYSFSHSVFTDPYHLLPTLLFAPASLSFPSIPFRLTFHLHSFLIFSLILYLYFQLLFPCKLIPTPLYFSVPFLHLTSSLCLSSSQYQEGCHSTPISSINLFSIFQPPDIFHLFQETRSIPSVHRFVLFQVHHITIFNFFHLVCLHFFTPSPPPIVLPLLLLVIPFLSALSLQDALYIYSSLSTFF